MDQISSPKPEPIRHDSLFEDFVKSVGYSAISAPVTAVGQFFDNDFQFLPQLKPQEAKAGSLAYYVQGAGSAVGLLADLAVMKRGLGALGETGVGQMTGLSRVMDNRIGSMALMG
ncbi:MAG TPA: hypothetical protein V6C72_04125, partial [Chroococcales cyanobacterium]